MAMTHFGEQALPPAQNVGLEKGLKVRNAHYLEELDQVEAELLRLEPLLKMLSGYEAMNHVLATYGEEGKEALLKTAEAAEAIRALQEQQGYPGLVESRRQLKQLILTGKMDLDSAKDVTE